MSSSARRVLRLYSRPGCELCDEFETALLEMLDPRVECQWRDIDRYPSLRREFGARIPVLTDAQDQVICEQRFEPQRVIDHLANEKSVAQSRARGMRPGAPV